MTLPLILWNQVLPTNIYLIEQDHTVYKVELSTLSQTQSEVWKEFKAVEGGWKNNQGLDQTVPWNVNLHGKWCSRSQSLCNVSMKDDTAAILNVKLLEQILHIKLLGPRLLPYSHSDKILLHCWIEKPCRSK